MGYFEDFRMTERDVVSQSVRFYLLYFCYPQPVFNNSKRSTFPHLNYFIEENPESAHFPKRIIYGGILEIAQKAIEGCHYHMMAYAFDFELAQNSNHPVFLIFSSKYQSRLKTLN